MSNILGQSMREFVIGCFTTMSETCICYLLLATFLKKRKNVSKSAFIFAFVAISLIQIALNNLHILYSIQMIIYVALDFVFVLFIFKDAWYKQIAYLGLFYLLVVMWDSAICTIIDYLFDGYSIFDHPTDYSALSVGITIIVRLFQLISVLLIRVVKSKNIRRKQWVGLLLIPVLTVVFCTIVYPRYWSVDNKEMDTLLIALGIFLVIQNLIVFSYVAVVQSSTDRYLELKEVHERQRQYFATIGAIQRTIRKMGHDIRHHFVYILDALEDGNIFKAKSYIIQIDESLDELIPVNITGHRDVDALLFVKAKQALEHNITIEVDGRLPADLNIAPIDLSVLLGNAFDNAIRAASKVDGDKVINVVFLPSGDNILTFSVSNPYAGKLRKKPNGFFFSQRQGGGLGGEIMQEVVSKYRGVLSIDTKDQLFTLTALLKTDLSVQEHPLLTTNEHKLGW